MRQFRYGGGHSAETLDGLCRCRFSKNNRLSASRVARRVERADRRARFPRFPTGTRPPAPTTISLSGNDGIIIPFLHPPLLPPTGSDSSTRIMFLERISRRNRPPFPSSSRDEQRARERKESDLPRRGISRFSPSFLLSRLREPRESEGGGASHADFALARAIPRSVRREPRAIMNYLAAAVSCRAGRDGGSLLLPRLGRI